MERLTQEEIKKIIDELKESGKYKEYQEMLFLLLSQVKLEFPLLKYLVSYPTPILFLYNKREKFSSSLSQKISLLSFQEEMIIYQLLHFHLHHQHIQLFYFPF